MKKILFSFAMLVFVGAVVAAGTGAFFSDTETSSGNTFTAGAIDLGIDNESYYNGVLNDETSWQLTFDLDDCRENPDFIDASTTPEIPEFLSCIFFDFDDLKPGDYGEDTISLHVTNNEAWLCADITLTSNDDVDCTEPEEDEEGDTCQNDLPAANADGDLAQELNFLWWADDGDNVLEEGEQSLSPSGTLGDLGVGNTFTVAFADSDENIFATSGPILTDDPEEILYIGKAWCFGDITPDAVPQDGVGTQMTPAGDNEGGFGVGNGTPGQPSDGGYTCNGAGVGNASQTDTATMDIAFRATQARNNPNYQCQQLQVLE